MAASIADLWGARDLVVTLTERELRARYKQALLGFLWAIVTPLALLVVFTVVFGHVVKVDTGGAPGPLFFYLGLLPWTFFSSAVAQGSASIVQNKAIVNKVYCPREAFPIGYAGVALVDTVLASLALVVLFVVEGFVPRATSAWVLVIIPVQIAFTLGVALAASAVLVHLRDLSQALPLILQIGLFATPVGYGLDRVPGSVRWLYALVNPIGPVIDGYRRAVLGGQRPDIKLLGLAALSSALALVGGYRLFKRLETGFADVA